MNETKIVEVILTQSHRGDGTETNPHRLCPELWTRDGRLIVRVDPCGMRAEAHIRALDALR